MFAHFQISSIVRTNFDTRVKVRFMTGDVSTEIERIGNNPVTDEDIMEDVTRYRGVAVTEVRQMNVGKRFTDEQIEIICARRLKLETGLLIKEGQRELADMPEPVDPAIEARPKKAKRNGP